MHVLLTGATGFVGSYVLRALVAAGHRVRCLVRSVDDPLAEEGETVEKVQGDITQPETLPSAVRGCDAVIHLVGIIEEQPSGGVTFEAIHEQGTRHVADAAREEGIDRFIHMSANGARPDGVSRYQTTKWQAEEVVKGAGFAHWTIFRPSVIFGDPGPENPEFATQLARTLVKPFPVLPVFGDGAYGLRPISAEEVATAFAQALTLEAARGETYCAAGKVALSYNNTLDVIARGLGLKPKPKLHVSLALARSVVRAAGKLGLLPVSPDQLEMLIEGNTCNPAAFYHDFEVEYQPFIPENLTYLRPRA